MLNYITIKQACYVDDDNDDDYIYIYIYMDKHTRACARYLACL